MGTTLIMASVSIQTMNVRAILGGFVCIILIVAFYNLFRGSPPLRKAAYLTIVGVIFVTSLILLASAIDAIVNTSEVWL